MMEFGGDRQSGQLLIGTRVDADYRDSDEPLYRHNCYIEALPPQLDIDRAISLMTRLPVYNDRERSNPPLQRIHAVMRIANCVIPLPIYVELEQKFARMVRNGYMARNPLNAQWIKQLRAGFPNLVWPGDGYQIQPHVRSSAGGFSIIGPSGAGKSTLIESVLTLTPQVIVHSQYDGQPFNQHQLVWLKLDCPFDGSPRGLCISFFQALDEILGTRYATMYTNNRKWTANDLLPTMARTAGAVGLGVLVIDEIQRLRGAHRDSADTLLNFFVQLTNTIGVPVVLVGTYKAFGLFTQEFALARRTTGQGDETLANLANDEYWDYFLETIWRYQWTDIPTPLSPSLKKAFYDESQGIVDVAVKLYMLVQWLVIGSGNERIVPDLVHKVARNNLRAVEPMLRALRNNDLEALSRIKDLRPPKDYLEEQLKKAVQRVSLHGALNTLQNQMLSAQASAAAVEDSPVAQVARQLIQVGFDRDVAHKCAETACNRFATATDIKAATAEAFRLAQEEDFVRQEAKEGPSPRPTREKAKVIPLSGDLREIIKNSPKDTPAYEALKNAGVIKDPMEFLPDV
jgi:energy-coupling factor transporter ATP-binding protein EcfA2